MLGMVFNLYKKIFLDKLRSKFREKKTCTESVVDWAILIGLINSNLAFYCWQLLCESSVLVRWLVGCRYCIQRGLDTVTQCVSGIRTYVISFSQLICLIKSVILSQFSVLDFNVCYIIYIWNWFHSKSRLVTFNTRKNMIDRAFKVYRGCILHSLRITAYSACPSPYVLHKNTQE